MLNYTELGRLLRGRDQRRRDLVDKIGAPNFRHSFGAIASSASEVVVMEEDFPASKKYSPLMSLLITNNSLADLDLEINGSDFLLIPAGVIDGITDQPIYSFRLTNNDAVAAAAGTVRANVTTPPLTADEAARRGL